MGLKNKQCTAGVVGGEVKGVRLVGTAVWVGRPKWSNSGFAITESLMNIIFKHAEFNKSM